jgi:dihydroorotase
VLEKQVEFDKAWNGVVGLETALGLTLSLVREGVMSLSKAVALLTDGPARAFGLPGGHLAAGAPADITVVEPDTEWTVDSARFFSRSRNTPFHGRRLTGRVAQTWVSGRLVFEDGHIKESR